jgi:hypothetical protein
MNEYDQNYIKLEQAFKYFHYEYKNTLKKEASIYIREAKVKLQANVNSFNEEEELRKSDLKIREISRKQKILSYNELDFVFNFLL